MKENKYDEDGFFHQYSQMSRSQQGLNGAGEWHVLKDLLPDFKDKKVLDLGCGYGWHCMYAIEKGAHSAIGIDISAKMIEEAKRRNNSPRIEYICSAIEDYNYQADSFDVVISSLAFHYLSSFDDVCQKVYKSLVAGGDFIFSVEHPVFTAYGNQDWYYDSSGNKLHWPIDRYFLEGKRNAIFLGENVVKYHKTLTTYINTLLSYGFNIKQVVEPEPNGKMLKEVPEMTDELRRPMFLIISSVKG